MLRSELNARQLDAVREIARAHAALRRGKRDGLSNEAMNGLGLAYSFAKLHATQPPVGLTRKQAGYTW